MKNFRQLKVWQTAHALTLAVYKVTRSFPREEMYGLTSQLRRSSASVPSNLAEGCGREGDAELARFCSIARGSASELKYQLLLARDLNLITESEHKKVSSKAIEVKKCLPLSLRNSEPMAYNARLRARSCPLKADCCPLIWHWPASAPSPAVPPASSITTSSWPGTCT